jgi:hypothetical protein
MAIDERSRHQLFQKLESVLGTEEAAILMEHLPPAGWAEVATKRDLDALADRLNGNLERRLSDLQHRMTLQMIGINGASILGVAALAFAAAKLV